MPPPSIPDIITPEELNEHATNILRALEIAWHHDVSVKDRVNACLKARKSLDSILAGYVNICEFLARQTPTPPASEILSPPFNN